MKKKMVVCALLLMVSAGYAPSVFSDENATPQEVYQMVVKAAGVIETLGDDALPEFNNPKGEFVWKDSYVYVADCAKPTCVAHPLAPNLIGADVTNLKDTMGNPFVMDLCKASKDANGGWTEYWWPKPGQPKDQGFRKISFSIQVPGSPYQVSAGIYNDTITLEELNATMR